MNEENVAKIRKLIENMSQDTPIKRECVIDCCFALNQGVSYLEMLFDAWLWKSNAENKSAGDFEYSLALAEIEEVLVHEGLIYDNGNK